MAVIKTVKTTGMINKDNWWGGLVLTMLLALIVFGAYCLSSGKTLDGIGVIVGVLVTKVGTMIDYRYGNSKEWQKKAEIPEPTDIPAGMIRVTQDMFAKYPIQAIKWRDAGVKVGDLIKELKHDELE